MDAEQRRQHESRPPQNLEGPDENTGDRRHGLPPKLALSTVPRFWRVISTTYSASGPPALPGRDCSCSCVIGFRCGSGNELSRILLVLTNQRATRSPSPRPPHGSPLRPRAFSSSAFSSVDAQCSSCAGTAEGRCPSAFQILRPCWPSCEVVTLLASSATVVDVPTPS